MLKTRFVINQALTTCLVSAAWTTVKPALATAASAEKGQHVEIRISVGQQVMTAVLDDTPTARDSIALLPLTVTLRDYSTAEKVSEALPRRLSEYGAPANAAGEIGDIAYYAPWGNIAFYLLNGLCCGRRDQLEGEEGGTPSPYAFGAKRRRKKIFFGKSTEFFLNKL